MPFSRTAQIGIGIGAAVVVVAIGAFVLRPAPVPVDIALAARTPLRVTVDQEGRTRVRERYVVAAPVAGRLERLVLREGDRVETGQTVALLAPLPLDASTHQQAEARLVSALALERESAANVGVAGTAAEQAQRTVDRRRLLAGGAISTEEYDDALRAAEQRRQELAAAESRERAASADVAVARAALLAMDTRRDGMIAVRSPVSGSVLNVPQQSERVIAAGTPVVEIGDPRSIELVVDVLSSDAVRIRAGDPVEIDEWGGDSALWGRVRLVEPSAFTKVSALGVDEQRVNVRVDIGDPPVTLGDNFRVEARIVVWQSRDVLTVPASALVQSRDGEWSIFVVQGGRAKRQPIDVGFRGAAAAQIRSGLSTGATVILFPSDQIRDGTRVRARTST